MFHVDLWSLVNWGVLLNRYYAFLQKTVLSLWIYVGDTLTCKIFHIFDHNILLKKNVKFLYTILLPSLKAQRAFQSQSHKHTHIYRLMAASLLNTNDHHEQCRFQCLAQRQVEMNEMNLQSSDQRSTTCIYHSEGPGSRSCLRWVVMFSQLPGTVQKHQICGGLCSCKCEQVVLCKIGHLSILCLSPNTAKTNHNKKLWGQNWIFFITIC